MKRHIPVQIEWHPDPAQPVPVYRQILEWMYGKIESGEWPAGTRLPSQREMARHFQVNRSTLNQALKPLLEAGVLQGRGSQGTVVASTAWSLRLPVQPDWNRYMTAGYFRANQEVVQAINTLEFDDRLVRLGTGELDPRLFPQDAFRQTMRDVADTITSLGYVEPLGMPTLRQALADYARKRGLIVAPSSILITSGALQGLQLISAGLLRGGATVYVEDPTYVKSLQVFQSAHLRLCGLPMDDQGLSLEALEKHLRQSSDRGNSVLYTIPTNHNPTGRTLSRRRRIQLLELCNRYDLPIIEDGAYEELTFDGTPPPSLKSLDPGGRVLYLGSVSKSLAPGLRIGWMIAPEPVVQRLGDVKMQIDYGASSLSQQVLARFLTSGRYEQYLDGLRCELQRRCQAACQSLADFPWNCSSAKPYRLASSSIPAISIPAATPSLCVCPMPIRRRKNSARLSVSWLWLSVRWKDERYREAFIRVRDALALGDDFRGIFRFVATGIGVAHGHLYGCGHPWFLGSCQTAGCQYGP